jgi:hypothetical protein
MVNMVLEELTRSQTPTRPATDEASAIKRGVSNGDAV